MQTRSSQPIPTAARTARGRRQTHGQHGFTLIETCIVVALLAILASAAAPGLQSLIESRRLNGVASQLAADVRYVRSAALAHNQSLRLSFHANAEATCYVVHTGSAAACACVDAGPAQCTGDATEIKTVVLAGAEHISVQANVASVLFDPVHGTSTPTGTLKVLDSHGRAVHHVINIMGRVRSCSPQGAVPGYRPC